MRPDREAVERLYAEHKEAVYRYLVALLRSREQAADLTQECFLAVLAGRASFDPTRGSVRTFLFVVARGLCLKHWRRRRLEQAWLDEEARAEKIEGPTVEGDVTMNQAMDCLTTLQREAVVLADIEELTLAEIARATSADVGTVKSRLHRGRERLRRLLSSRAGELK
jgi:RNA polymerase sigma-70 factor (ECF subfamily)